MEHPTQPDAERDTSTHLHELARIYNTTASMGYPATDEVARRMGISLHTAGRRARAAHRAGLIPQIQRRPSRKLLDVADALDVTPADLARAVHSIAGGTLTVTNQTLIGARP